MTQISAKIIADSKNEFGNRITTMVVTFPRYILAELNTHRMLSKNSASSRAIPFEKLLKSVEENPFIPIAWMKDHKGMQGSEYFESGINDLIDNHLRAKDSAIERAKEASARGLTKQIVNRYLEPFMWHTVIITATELENFFALRCPQYAIEGSNTIFRSWKDYAYEKYNSDPEITIAELYKTPIIERLQLNKGQADIHMMALAEAMWDAYNKSTPKELKAGEWHIPYEEEIKEMYDINQLVLDNDNIPVAAKIGSIMAARISYTVVGTELSEWNINKYCTKFNELVTASPIHASPFEHCAPAMTELEYLNNIIITFDEKTKEIKKELGVSGNFRGFIQLRKMLPNENITK